MDENPKSSVIAETWKLLAKNSYGYQIMDRSQNTLTKCVFDRKIHVAIDIKVVKKLNHANNALHEVGLTEAANEHKEPIIVGLSILENSKLRILELYYSFSPFFVI